MHLDKAFCSLDLLVCDFVSAAWCLSSFVFGESSRMVTLLIYILCVDCRQQQSNLSEDNNLGGGHKGLEVPVARRALDCPLYYPHCSLHHSLHHSLPSCWRSRLLGLTQDETYNSETMA